MTFTMTLITNKYELFLITKHMSLIMDRAMTEKYNYKSASNKSLYNITFDAITK